MVTAEEFRAALEQTVESYQQSGDDLSNQDVIDLAVKVYKAAVEHDPDLGDRG